MNAQGPSTTPCFCLVFFVQDDLADVGLIGQAIRLQILQRLQRGEGTEAARNLGSPSRQRLASRRAAGDYLHEPLQHFRHLNLG